MTEGINDAKGYVFNSTNNNYKYIHYSNSSAKSQLESWYEINIIEKEYDNYIKIGNYFCEQAKVEYSSSYTTGSATPEHYDSYTPNFKCENDGNGYGFVNSSIGLLNYDEIIHAGGYPLSANLTYYLYYPHGNWIMSPNGFYDSIARGWLLNNQNSDGKLAPSPISGSYRLRPVINLKADVEVTGIGTSTDPYVVQ